MRPVLLQKSEVDKHKAEERRQTIAEGMKLAERVDILRETLANEERMFEGYRVQTSNSIQDEIQNKHIENERLDIEINAKKEDLLRLMKPEKIYENWMRYVKEEKEHIDAQVAKNDIRSAELVRSLSETKEQKHMNEEEMRKLSLERKEYGHLIHMAKEEVHKAKEIIINAKKEARSLNNIAKQRDTESRKRESKVIEYEQFLKLKEEAHAKEAQNIQSREFKVIAKELQFNSPIRKV